MADAKDEKEAAAREIRGLKLRADALLIAAARAEEAAAHLYTIAELNGDAEAIARAGRRVKRAARTARCLRRAADRIDLLAERAANRSKDLGNI